MIFCKPCISQYFLTFCKLLIYLFIYLMCSPISLFLKAGLTLKLDHVAEVFSEKVLKADKN